MTEQKTQRERFAQASRLQKLGIVVGLPLAVVAAVVLAAVYDNFTEESPQPFHPPDGALGGAAVSQVYRISVDVELVQACADYRNDREAFIARVLDAAQPVGADRIMPNRNDVTAWERIAC